MTVITTGVTVNDETDEYKVLEEIGSGAFGRVFKIRRQSDKKIFAIKTIDSEFPDKEVLTSFSNEAKLALGIEDENVVNYLYYNNGTNEYNYPPYIIMEYVKGPSLRDFLTKKKKENSFFENKELLDFFNQLIKGMIAINKSIIHRDLKPENILIGDSSLKITDFGLGKVSEDSTKTHSFKGSGTYPYMSPEAWQLDENTIKMDIYSMGLVFYELATLKMPFEEFSPRGYEGWKNAHMHESLKTPEEYNHDLTNKYSSLIQSMIKKNKNDRIECWEKIKEFLDSEEEGSDKTLVKEIIKEKTERDRDVELKQIERDKIMKDKEEKEKLTQFQFKEKISAQIDSVISTINKGFVEPEYIKARLNKLHYEIIIGTKSPITMNCKTIYEEDFYKDIEREWLGRTVRKEELQLPTLEDKEILCWGEIESSSGIGHNLILVRDNKTDIYGHWLILTTKNSPLMEPRHCRYPEPFKLNYAELELQLRGLGGLDIYDTKIEKFNIDIILELIKKHI